MKVNPWRSSSIKIALEGRSFIDIKRIHIDDFDEANDFLNSYGFDMDDPNDRSELFDLKQEAQLLIEEELLKPSEKIPDKILDISDVRQLLLDASQPRLRQHAQWCGGLLKVIHTLAHSYSYLNDVYHRAIREQILQRFQPHIKETANGVELGDVELVKFEMRPEKTRRSVAMKLLHKAENVSADIFDWIGIRFITKSKAQVLDVLAYLRNHYLIAYANLKPSRTRNTLLDLDWLKMQTRAGHSIEQIKQTIESQPYPSLATAASDNPFSSIAYHSIQFTCRQRIKIEQSSQSLRFFFPFEIQIMDKVSYDNVRQGLASHAAYKERQRQLIRQRVLAFLDK
ncbi:MAG: TIGR04552 family protein [Gammaproteobacteria bacterium]|nr:TIGR04552 family protein [Gammaproteobacteria bacterium]